MNHQAARPQRPQPRLIGWRPSLSVRQVAQMVRTQQLFAATSREVEAIEYLDDGSEPILSQLGSLEQHDGAMWMVCGIYEPVDPHAPWAIALIARRDVGPVLRTPSVLVAQDAVTRVYDGIDD